MSRDECTRVRRKQVKFSGKMKPSGKRFAGVKLKGGRGYDSFPSTIFPSDYSLLRLIWVNPDVATVKKNSKKVLLQFVSGL